MNTATDDTPTTSPRVNAVRQLLRLTRTELTLFYRYRVAAFYAVFPLFFAFILMGVPNVDLVPGVGAAALSTVGMVAMAPMMIAIFHIPNVLAARRELMILKRFRVSGVGPFALFGAVTLSVLCAGLLVAAVMAVLAGVPAGLPLPRDPVMVLVGVLLGGTVVSLLAASLTRLARNAESAQMMTILPFLVLFAASGLMLPLDLLPDAAQVAARLLPIAPMVDMVSSGWFGYDFFGGREGAETASVLSLWGSSVPALLVGIAWLGITFALLRGFRWDPRGAK
ncbi:ABC transporter permease [Spiractinospora alimapuensis]|uniref:ABC transporter permease n=1 Tax=Spiractinospora alimapuensis TaxID=2820884 RepID=UPI001F3482AB|nr:ABC transporter permease [Spiractinospora alimapuensis]QVQ50690.1 ABC transporter permease [Spiractinospora alimapuensis]